MFERLTPATALLLTVPPLLWADNAVVGRLADGLVPPITLNFLRWALAFVLLLPFAGTVLRPGGAVWKHTGAPWPCWDCWASVATTHCSTWR